MRIPPGAPSGSLFYQTLHDSESATPGAVIEYPIPIGDVSSAYFIGQQLHGRRVLGGYVRTATQGDRRLRAGLTVADQPIDRVLGEITEPSRLHFASLVDLQDAHAVHASGARYLLIHRDLPREIGRTTAPAAGLHRSPLRKKQREELGVVVFEDEWLEAIELRGRP